MKPAVDMTGGMVVMSDTFLNPVFKESFKRVFARPGTPGALALSSNATFEVSIYLLPKLPNNDQP
jgi:protein transport protein SEC23